MRRRRHGRGRDGHPQGAPDPPRYRGLRRGPSLRDPGYGFVGRGAEEMHSADPPVTPLHAPEPCSAPPAPAAWGFFGSEPRFTPEKRHRERPACSRRTLVPSASAAAPPGRDGRGSRSDPGRPARDDQCPLWMSSVQSDTFRVSPAVESPSSCPRSCRRPSPRCATARNTWPPGSPDPQEYRPRLRADEPIDRCERPQVAIPSCAFMADSSLCVRTSPDRRRGLGESQRPSWMAGRLRVQPHRSGRLHQGAPQPASSPHGRSARIRQCRGAAGIPCAAQSRAGPVAISTRSIRPTKTPSSLAASSRRVAAIRPRPAPGDRHGYGFFHSTAAAFPPFLSAESHASVPSIMGPTRGGL